MDRQDKNREGRKQRRLEQLRTKHPVCSACGCTDWCVFEVHHIAGRHFDAHTEPVCANCHRRLTEKQKSHPKPTSKEPGKIECAGHYCLGLSDIIAPVARMIEEFGNSLIQL